MAEHKKRVVVIGYGGMGAWHTRHLANSDVAEVAGIFDISPQKCALAAEKGIFVYSSLEAVLSDSSVDIVTIATPNDVHMEIAIAAMRAGKNVICEKPVALNHSQLEKMIETAEQTGRLFTVHQNRRWDCDFLMMKRVYDGGELGDVFSIESRIQGSRGIPGDWRGCRQYGGGMMLDWGVHLIDQMLLLVGDKKIKRLYCRCDHITNYEVDDGFKLDLYFEDDITARIEVGTSNFIAMPRYYMAGTNGSAIINTLGGEGYIVCCKNWNEKNVVPVVTAAGLTKTMAPRDEKTITRHDIDKIESDVHDFYRNACLAIDKKAQQLVTHRQLLRVMRVMETAFESDRLGMPVDFDDIYFDEL